MQADLFYETSNERAVLLYLVSKEQWDNQQKEVSRKHYREYRAKGCELKTHELSDM